MNKSLKCANYKSVLRVQHPAPQDWVWISHDDDDDDDYGDDHDHSARNYKASDDGDENNEIEKNGRENLDF